MPGTVPGPTHLGSLLLIACLVVPALPGTAASQASVDLEVQPELRMDQTLLFIGNVGMMQAQLADPGAVTVKDLVLPGGTLFVCPNEGGQRDEVPPFPVLEERCREEERFEDPALRFGRRTWLTFGGNHTMVDGANASMTLFTREGPQPGPLLMAQAISVDGVGLALDQGRMAFTPLLGSSEVTVETDDRTRQYNGTDWVFYFQGDQDGRFHLAAQGLFGGLREAVDLEVSEADTDRLRPVLDPERLLDLQDAALGADAREPIRNATALFADRGRVPGLLNGALLGHVNGTVGARTPDPGAVTVVRVDQLNGEVQAEGITGQANVLHWSQGGAISQGLDDPAQVPWVWIGVLFAVAGMAWLLGWTPAKPPRWEPWAVTSLAVVGMVAWDLRFGSVMGTSGLEGLVQGGDLGVILALLGFELIAAGLTALAVYLPLKIGLRRGLTPRWNRWGRLGAATGWALILVLLPATVIVIGQLVARL